MFAKYQLSEHITVVSTFLENEQIKDITLTKSLLNRSLKFLQHTAQSILQRAAYYLVG